MASPDTRAMADVTPDQLSATTTVTDTDLLLVYILSDAVLKKVAFSTFLEQVIDGLSGEVLVSSANLGDVDSVSAARANLGLGSAALLNASAVLQVSNNLGEVANAAQARSNIGAAASSAPSITGGMTLTGPAKQNVVELAGTEIDVSAAEFFTDTISANTAYTFTGAAADKAQGFILVLNITNNAKPTFPASVKWTIGSQPDPGNGEHAFGFFTVDGGASWIGLFMASNVS